MFTVQKIVKTLDFNFKKFHLFALNIKILEKYICNFYESLSNRKKENEWMNKAWSR